MKHKNEQCDTTSDTKHLWFMDADGKSINITHVMAENRELKAPTGEEK